MMDSQKNGNETTVEAGADVDKKLDWVKKLWTFILPVYAKSKSAIKADDPRTVLFGNAHNRYALLGSLIGVMALTVAAYCAGQYVPNRQPFDVMLDHFEPFIKPKIDFAVGAQLLLYPVGLACTCYLFCWFCGIDAARRLPMEKRRAEEEFVRDLSVACVFLVSVLIIAGAIGLAFLSWGGLHLAQRYLKEWSQLLLYLSFDNLAFWAAFPFVFFVSLKIRKIFRKAKIHLNRPLIVGLAIPFLVCTGSMLGAAMTFDQTYSAFFKRGHVTAKMYELPVTGIVQFCATDYSKINCTIALFPEAQQNFEYIGTWTLSRYPQSGIPAVIPIGTWQPTLQSGRSVPVVSIEEHKDMSVDVSMNSEDLCGKTSLEGGERDAFFFLVKGRAKGELRNAPRDFRIHIENNNPKFANLIASACG